MPEEVTPRDEKHLLDCVDRVVAHVEHDRMDPTAAVAKVARDQSFGPGMIGLLSRAYNTGRQLAQWRANDSVLDKMASFALADAAQATALVYPPAVSPPAMAKAAVDADYARPPLWRPDRDRQEALRRELPRIKAASATETQPAAAPLLQKIASADKLQLAVDESRRHAAACQDRLGDCLAELTDYLKQASYQRLPLAQIEHAARTYFGPSAVAFLKLAATQARVREPDATTVPLWSRGFDLQAAPFPAIVRGCKLAEDTLQARGWADEAATLFKQAREALKVAPTKAAATTSEKKGFLEEALSGGFGGMVNKGLGEFPSSREDLVNADVAKLESPEHKNELRKIRVHSMLNGLMTDPEDPISGHEPDKILSAYNEIAQMAPRLAEQPAALRPLLRKRLAGHNEPFEVKEIADMEKSLAQTNRAPEE